MSIMTVGVSGRGEAPWPRSNEYINGVAAWFRGKGFTVELQMGRNPDDDIVYLGLARHFFRGGGGFSRVAAGIVQHTGGTVYDMGGFR